jgi:hypothetical protein
MTYSSSLRDLRVMALCGTLFVGSSNCGGGTAAMDGGGGSGAAGGGASGSAGTSGAGGIAGAAGGGVAGRGGGDGGGAGGTGGSLTCGTETCTGTQICVHPACGGGTPSQCMPVGDGGQCLTGWTLSTTCAGLGGQGVGCMPPPCTPPAPFCADIPASCSGAPTCGCLPSLICNQPSGQPGGGCGFVTNRQVTCGFA